MPAKITENFNKDTLRVNKPKPARHGLLTGGPYRPQGYKGITLVPPVFGKEIVYVGESFQMKALYMNKASFLLPDLAMANR